ncbi:hypothetical protein V8C86DRAFT_3137945, partial [Haematococcus lacustris]
MQQLVLNGWGDGPRHTALDTSQGLDMKPGSLKRSRSPGGHEPHAAWPPAASRLPPLGGGGMAWSALGLHSQHAPEALHPALMAPCSLPFTATQFQSSCWGNPTMLSQQQQLSQDHDEEQEVEQGQHGGQGVWQAPRQHGDEQEEDDEDDNDDGEDDDGDDDEGKQQQQEEGGQQQEQPDFLTAKQRLLSMLRQTAAMARAGRPPRMLQHHDSDRSSPPADPTPDHQGPPSPPLPGTLISPLSPPTSLTPHGSPPPHFLLPARPCPCTHIP